jgi:phytol kinase
MKLILTVLAVFLVLVVNEALWRNRKTHGELSRKFVHISVGCFVAFWPFFLSWHDIEALSLAFLVVVGLSDTLNVFKAIRSVQRPTWGEICFALSVGLVALATHNKWIYMAAILQMGLSDGLAAIVGVRFGRSNSYTVMGHSKSVAGTVTFFLVSMVILAFYNHFTNQSHLNIIGMAGISLISSLLENASIRGLDNLAVPLLTAVLLR